MNRLSRLDVGGIVPDFTPVGPIGMHAALAVAEHWRLAVLGTCAAVARFYMHDHYRRHPELGEERSAQRRHELETSLRECIKALGAGDE
jgi:hypothetical protein